MAACKNDDYHFVPLTSIVCFKNQKSLTMETVEMERLNTLVLSLESELQSKGKLIHENNKGNLPSELERRKNGERELEKERERKR